MRKPYRLSWKYFYSCLFIDFFTMWKSFKVRRGYLETQARLLQITCRKSSFSSKVKFRDMPSRLLEYNPE